MRCRSALVVGVLLAALAGCGGTGRKVPAIATTSQTSTPGPVTATPPTPDSMAHAAGVVLGASGSLIAAVPGDGPISAAAPDGRGGWYVGGSFTRLAGRSEPGLAHLLANGTVDPAFNSMLRSSGRVALAADSGTLYAAASIGDTNTSRLAVLDGRTGVLVRRLASPAGVITALVVAGGRLIVGTTGTAGAIRSTCVTALDPQTGQSAPGFSVNLPEQPELGCATAITVDGGRLYLSGAFQSVDGVRRGGLARIDAGTGALDRGWQPPVVSCRQAGPPRGSSGCDGVTYEVALAPGRVFAAGSSPGVVALSDASGAALPVWRAPGGIQDALGLAVAGGRLYVGGDFTAHGHIRLNGLAALDPADGSLLSSWHPPAGLSAATVVSSASEVLVGLHSGR